MQKKSAYYPLFLNIRNKRCVVVGGGQVALRKVRMLLGHDANVVVISPGIAQDLLHLAENGAISVRNREFKAGDLQGAFIAIAATDSEKTNRIIAREAKEQKVLVNAVDDAEISDFIVPSYICRGDVTIAISTAGKSPALARKIRTRLEKEFGEEYAALALLISEIRAEIKRRKVKVTNDDWQKALDLNFLLRLLKKGEGEKARDTLYNALIKRKAK